MIQKIDEKGPNALRKTWKGEIRIKRKSQRLFSMTVTLIINLVIVTIDHITAQVLQEKDATNKTYLISLFLPLQHLSDIIENLIRDFSFRHQGEVFLFAAFINYGDFVGIGAEDAAFR